MTNKRSTTNHNPDAIDKLIIRLDELIHTDLDETYELALQVHRLASEIGYARGMSRCDYYVAQTYVYKGDLDAALTFALSALSVAEDNELLHEAADATTVIAVIHANARNYSEALSWSIRQLRLAEELGDATLLTKVHHNLAGIQSKLDHHEYAIQHHEKALEYASSSDNPELRTTFAMAGFGDSYLQMGNLLQARRYSMEALENAHNLGLHYVAINALLSIAQTHLQDHEYDLAAQFMQQALTEATSAGIDMMVLVTKMKMGELEIHRDNHEHALPHFQSVLQMAKEISNSDEHLTEIHHNLAICYRELDETEQSFKHYDLYIAHLRHQYDTQTSEQAQLLFTQYDLERAKTEAENHRLRSEALQREIDEMKRSEIARLEQERLRISLAKEREISDIKQDILTRLAHEFRTPLTTLKTSTDLLVKFGDRLNEEKRLHHKSVIDGQIAHYNEMIDDVLDVLRGTYNTLEYNTRPLNLASFVQENIEKLPKTLNPVDRVKIHSELDNQEYLLDPNLIQQIMQNLLSNALKFSSDTVGVYLSSSDSNVIIKVQDTGIGIPPDEVENIFEPLRRGKNIGEIQGNGLGMTIIRDCVALHDGTLSLDSKASQGTTVTVQLPIGQ